MARQPEETSALMAAGASSSLGFFPLGFFCFSDAFVSISSSSGRRVPPTDPSSNASRTFWRAV